jgi:hypothetical protein
MKSKYNITDYTKKQAEKLGVTVKPSSDAKKKVDVFDKKGNLITKIVDSNYKDYGTYIKEKGLAYADKRRELYKIRHDKDRKVKGSAGFYADKLLW